MVMIPLPIKKALISIAAIADEGLHKTQAEQDPEAYLLALLLHIEEELHAPGAPLSWTVDWSFYDGRAAAARRRLKAWDARQKRRKSPR
jgi:hypothetical protein